VNGSNEQAGRIEIFWNRRWYTICDNGWDDNDAVVVCKQLGYSGGSARSGAYFGEGTGFVMLDSVNCFGNELNLFQCNRSNYRERTCHHHQDAGVVCATEGTEIRYRGFYLFSYSNVHILCYFCCVKLRLNSCCHTVWQYCVVEGMNIRL